MERKRIAIVGAGIVGLSCAWHLLEAGHAVTIVDREPEGDRVSLGNAGGIAVTEVVPASVPGVFLKIPKWLFDPVGPLSLRWRHVPRLIPWMWRFSQVSSGSEMRRIAAAISALNSRTYLDLEPMLAACGLASKLHKKGALSVYETEAAFAADEKEWNLKRSYGIVCEPLGGEEAREIEPALGSLVRKAIFTPQWSHVSDPQEIHSAVFAQLTHRGTKIIRSLAKRIVNSPPELHIECEGREPIAADAIVVAAGVWAGALAATVGDRVLLESERGYNTTLPAPGIELTREVIFAERKVVATPLTSGIRIGGAAEFGGLDSTPNFQRSHALLKLAKRYLPDLETTGGTQWSGHRPATPDSLPVIGRSPRNPRVIYGFGHGHLGLTQAATTGRIVADLVGDRPVPINISPYSIERFRKGV